MDSVRGELAAALSRLMAASQTLKPEGLSEGELAEYREAQEQAAKALVKNRARVGRAWATAPDSGSFFDRWRVLRGQGDAAAGLRRIEAEIAEQG